MRLAAVLPPASGARARRWRDAIAGALVRQLRHSPACFRRGALLSPVAGPVTFDQLSVPGCPWCDHVRSGVMGGGR